MARCGDLRVALLLALLVGAFGGGPYGDSPDLPQVGYQELYYQQWVDHFNPIAHKRWPHRYLLNDQFWDGRGELKNGCKGPILMYAGNEANIEGFWKGNGFFINELAPKWGGLLLFPEQRYYGKSLPFGNETFTTPHLAYLTTSQTMEDFVELIAYVKAKLPGASRCPVVTFGGSYGGTLAALLRASYPTVFTGALAASSELGYYDVHRWAEHGVNEFSFEDAANRDYEQAHPQCMYAIQRAKQAIEATSDEELMKLFNVCEVAALGPDKWNLFAYSLEGLPQQDYPYAVGHKPGNPINVSCALLVDALHSADSGSALVAAAAKISWWSDGSEADPSKCIPNEGPDLIQGPGDATGPGPWGWQSCTETMHRFSARGVRNYVFDYDAQAAVCTSTYGPGVVPDTDALARRLGGFALADGSSGVTKIIWSQGSRDTWGGWWKNIATPPAGSEIYHFFMEGAAHHLDLRGSRPDADPPDVTAARKQETEIIERWIYEASGGPVHAADAVVTKEQREDIIFA